MDRNPQAWLGSIQWQNGQDLCTDTLYVDSRASKSQVH